MQLIYNNKQIEIEQNNLVFTEIFKKVNKLIEQKDIVFSHLIINGVDVYENHETYINERINEIIQIEIITRTTKEIIWDTMGSIHEYLERAVPALKELVYGSYEGFTEETWEGISHLSEGFEWMLQFKIFTQEASEQPDGWNEFVNIFEACEEHFTPLLEAIEVRDEVLISDILAYEITPAYKAITESIKNMLKDNQFLKKVN